jgi:FixJ family two-component response regulator
MRIDCPHRRPVLSVPELSGDGRLRMRRGNAFVGGIEHVSNGGKLLMDEASKNTHIHVIDMDFRRRAQISNALTSRHFHTEIYEDPAEFIGNLPKQGSILINDDPERSDLDTFFGMVQDKGRFYPISVYSHAPAPPRIVRAIRNGAIDYLQWPFEPALLDLTLRRLVDQGDRQLKIEQEKGRAKAMVAQLTRRETDVLVSLLSGNSNKEVAEELAISPRTVEIYRKNMMSKLSARSASEAARIAIYAGLWEVQGTPSTSVS